MLWKKKAVVSAFQKLSGNLNVRVRREPKADSEQVGLIVLGAHKDDIVKTLETRFVPGWVKLHPDMYVQILVTPIWRAQLADL